MARILAVEDNAVYAKLYQAVVGAAGHDVTVCEDGPSALETMATASFDLVLMDLYLPGMDGFEVTQSIRATPGLADLPIIAISAATESGIDEKVAAAGCNTLLGKPFKRDQLLKLIDDLLPS